MKPFRTGWLVTVLLAGFLFGANEPGACSAAGPGEGGGPAADLDSSPVQAGVELRWRFEARDNADLRSLHDFERFLGQRIRAYLRFHINPQLSFYVQGQDVGIFGARTDKVIHDQATNLHQAYLDWNPGGNKHWELRAGRQEFIYGEERLVGGFGWDNVGRAFDAVRMRYRAGAWATDIFGGRMVDVRRGGTPRRPAGQDLAGFYLTRASAKKGGQTEIYGLFLRDGLRLSGELPGTAGNTRIATIGLRRLHRPAAGWRYSIEHAWQFGHRGPDSHAAAMLIGSGGYAWDGRFQPRIGIEYDFATGDNNAQDRNSREFHNLFPTNHPFYGYADLLGLRNLHGVRLTAAANPLPKLVSKLVVEADYHRFFLAARRGAWKNAAGRVLGSDPTGRAGRDIGHEVDLTLRVPLQKHLSLLAGYSVFLPGRFAASTRGTELHNFGYIQTSVVF